MPMLKNLEIQNFGCYQNFLGFDERYQFKKFNLIYGTNYSGKTTLSRIFKSILDKKFPERYDNPSFRFLLEDNSTIDNSNFNLIDKKIIVFNKDFISENLSFLMNNSVNSGSIESFSAMIIGLDAIELEKNIEINNNLINEQSKLKDNISIVIENIEKDLAALDKNILTIENSIKTKAASKAKEFADNGFTPTRVYREDHLKKDINKIIKSKKVKINENKFYLERDINDEELKNYINDSKVSKKERIDFKEKYKELINLIYTDIEEIKEILAFCHIKQYQKNFIVNEIFKDWIELGYKLHKDHNSEKCEFCGNPLIENFLKNIEDCFDNKEKSFLEKIDNKILRLQNISQQFILFINTIPDPTLYLYQSNIQEHTNLINNINTEIRKIESLLKDSLILNLRNKKNDLSLPNILDIDTDCLNNFLSLCTQLKELYDKNDLFGQNIETKQLELKNKILNDKIIYFINDFQWIEKYNEIDALKVKKTDILFQLNRTKEELIFFENNILIIQNIIYNLIKQRSNESAATEIINKFLNSFFGHQHLKIEPFTITNENQDIIKFKVKRNNLDAYNLSEGECTLIAFCYFISMAYDLKLKNLLENYVIFIDDPISSLDSNNIFYIFSLIDTIICKEKKYKQVFISTHNLEFFKYLRKLTLPKVNKPYCTDTSCNSNKTKEADDVSYYLIEKVNGVSKISKIPSYLKKYNTEFNYLFSQIHKCASLQEENFSEDLIYNFANNMRKFMEIYIFFKYPSDNKKSIFRENFYDAANNSNHYELMNRIMNEYSHAEEIFDRSMNPLNAVEMKSAAQFLLSRLELSDKTQFDALKESVKDLI